MISYRSKDGKFIDFVQNFLEKNGILCWRDRRMEVGSNWSEDITFAVRNSGCVVSVLSEPYIASSLCTKEVRMARAVNRVVLPVILPQTENKNPKLVSEHYKGEGPPHTLSAELSEVTLIDFRALNGGTDPTNLESFESKYMKPLRNLLTGVRDIQRENVVCNVSGYWTITVTRTSPSGIPDIKEQECTLFLVHKRKAVSGHALFWNQGKALTVDQVGSSVTGSMINIIFKSGALKFDLRAQISMNGDSFQGLIFSNHATNSRGICSGTRTPYHPSHPHRRLFTDEDWVEDKVSCFYNTMVCGDYDSFKALWRHDLDPHKSNMPTPEKFIELSNEFRTKYGYFAFAHFLKADRSVMLDKKYEFEVFFNLKRGRKALFKFDLKHKITSAEEEEENKPKEKKGFLSSVTSAVSNISNVGIIRDTMDRVKSGADELSKLLDQFEVIKEFRSTSSDIAIAPAEQPKSSLAPLNTSPPVKEIFLDPQSQVQESVSKQTSFINMGASIGSSIGSSMKHMMGKEAPAPAPAPAQAQEPEHKEEKKSGFGGFASGLKDKVPKFGFGKKN